MEMRADGVGGGRPNTGSRRAARERLDWLAGLCSLSWQEEQILALLMGLDDGEPARRWWLPRALAERLALGARERPDLGARERPDLGARERSSDETVVAAALAPGAALTQWGLVRTDGTRVTVNLRIAQFLLG
jgi:hypothetical protein